MADPLPLFLPYSQLMVASLALVDPGGIEERLSPEEQALFDERQAARRARDFARADAARARLEGLGVVLEDAPKGTRWGRKR